MTQTTNTVLEFLDIQLMSEHIYKLQGDTGERMD